jgi:hypothetical protein
VENDNRYIDVSDDSNLSNDVVMFWYNSSNFDLNCFLPTLQNPPDWFINLSKISLNHLVVNVVI